MSICHEFKTKKQKIIRLINNYQKAINILRTNENIISLEEYDEYKELLEQKIRTEQMTTDKDLFDSIFSNKIIL